jgi:hypothetical protein
MENNVTVDFGALTSLERIVGFLISLASAIALTWVVEKRQRVAPADEFKQARNIALVATAVLIALIYVFMAGSARLIALGTTAGGCVVGCFVFFLWNVWSGLLTGANREPTRVITYLGTFILYVVFGSVGLSAAGLLLYVVQVNPENKTAEARAAAVQAYEVTAELLGRRVVSEVGELSPFVASSGQVNFACEQTVPATAVWQAPPGAIVQGEIRANWVNSDNARSFQANVVVQDRKVVATGSISGLELQRLPFGITNCSGGGHGELVVSGKYVTRSTAQQEYRETLRGAVSTSPDAARSVQLTLPAEGDVSLESIRLSLKSDKGTADTATISPGTPPVGNSQASANGLFTASIGKCDDKQCVSVSLNVRN